MSAMFKKNNTAIYAADQSSTESSSSSSTMMYTQQKQKIIKESFMTTTSSTVSSSSSATATAAATTSTITTTTSNKTNNIAADVTNNNNNNVYSNQQHQQQLLQKKQKSTITSTAVTAAAATTTSIVANNKSTVTKSADGVTSNVAENAPAPAAPLTKKKSKKSKKSDVEKENISVRSSFSKFDALQKKNILHVRSSDSGKALDKFSANAVIETESKCKACDKIVYKMEELKAERNIWHKGCFKCSVCQKPLTIDTYQSHEAILYCKSHFKALFTPKAVEDEYDYSDSRALKSEVIIRENQPIELPPDVIRSSDKSDLGLEELHQLNVRSRFEVFEHGINEQQMPPKHTPIVPIGGSKSVRSKLTNYQMKVKQLNKTNNDNYNEDDDNNDDNGAADTDDINDSDIDVDENGDEDVDMDLVRAKRVQRERPLSFANMNEIKNKFESGHGLTKEERREERKQEIQNIRSRLFMGKQAKIKEMYKQAVLDSEQGMRSVDKEVVVDLGDKARSIKNKFESGEFFKNNDDNMDMDNNNNNNNYDGTNGQSHENQSKRSNPVEMIVIEKGLGKQSRNIFKELDAKQQQELTNATNNYNNLAISASQTGINNVEKSPDIKKLSQPFQDVIKHDEKVADIKIETADITNRFKFFETYKPTENNKKEFRITPPRDGVVKLPSPDRDDIYLDPDVIRSDRNNIDKPLVAEQQHTTTKMLSVFRKIEEDQHNKDNQQQQYDLKPLKHFTPPPEDHVARRNNYNNNINNNNNNNNRNSDESDYTNSEDEDDDDDEEDESDGNDQELDDDRTKRYTETDEFLKQAQTAERAKHLRAKFERWETTQLKNQNLSNVSLYDGGDQSQIETAKNLREKFESLKNQPSAVGRDRARVNRFL